MQKTEKIQSFKLAKLRQTEALGFFQRTQVAFRTCTDAKFKTLLAKFDTEIAAFTKAVNPQTDNATTEPITAADNRRDNALYGLFGQVRATCKHFDAATQAAARRLYAITKDYVDITNLPYIQENGKITALLRDLSTEAAKIDLAKTGTEGWVTEITNANKAFTTLFDKRNMEISGNVTGHSLDCRRACENAFRACVDMINALVMVNGAAAYQTLVDNVNELISYQKQVLAARIDSDSDENK